ncbi:MAG TPA: hypothetical protein VF035_05590 [Longimicrobiales bacterium]
MSDRMQDGELRALFDAQRRVDAGDMPSFADMLASASAAHDVGVVPISGRHRWRREWTGALAAAAAVTALIVIPRLQTGDDEFERAVREFETSPALGAWQSPTDALLRLPGDALLSGVPSVELESR